MKVTNEMIRAARIAMCGVADPVPDNGLEAARAALEAVAPMIARQAAEEEREACKEAIRNGSNTGLHAPLMAQVILDAIRARPLPGDET